MIIKEKITKKKFILCLEIIIFHSFSFIFPFKTIIIFHYYQSFTLREIEEFDIGIIIMEED